MKKSLLGSVVRPAFAVLLGSSVAIAFACSAGGGQETSGLPTGSSSGGGTNNPGSGAGPNNPGSGAGPSNPGSGTGPIIVPPEPDAGPDVREVRCDEAGNCTCINVGVLGRPPSYGAGGPGSDTTVALQSWLNTKSSAAVDLITTKPAITAEWLANYDVLILQALEQAEGVGYWTFTPDEIAAFEAWVRAGGGVIALMGYGGLAAEVDPTNQLLAFTGMSYNKDDILFDCPDSCCYCFGAAVPMGGWNPAHPISANITYVGAFHGRSINAGDGEIVASGPPMGGVGATVVYGATKKIDNGHVFLFNDEWVTYTSQWNSAGTECSTITDVNHSCYQKTPDKYFQVQQFWYNSLLYASGDRECFTIDDPVIVK